MSASVFNQRFSKVDFTKQELAKEYESCTFVDCNFEGTLLSQIQFVECEFHQCNLSTAKISGTGWKQVVFKGCKMLGLHFEQSNPFLLELAFENCVLNYSCFYKKKLKSTRFLHCQLEEVDFSEADLHKSLFTGSTLSLATFDQTNLTEADFSEAFSYRINPTLNQIRKAKFSFPQAAGLLNDFGIELV